MSLTAKITAAVRATKTGSADLPTVNAAYNEKAELSLTNGTGSGQADLIWSDTRTLAASATENLDLAGGLTDEFRTALTFVEVVAVYVKAASANTNDVLFGGAASNGFSTPFGDASDVVKIKPGGVLLLTNPVGYGVTASTGDILKMANSSSGSSVTYDIIVVGRSA